MKTAVYMRPYWRSPRIGTGQTCPVCGAQFRPSDDWGCKYGQTLVCSIPCMREMDRRARARRLNTLKRTTQYRAWKLKQDGKSVAEVAAALGVPQYKASTYIHTFEDVHQYDIPLLIKEGATA